jgi:branched-chain amino acid transport system ATP-binding protein
MNLRIHQLSCHRNGAEVLRDISLEVSGGQVVAILGANGAGKSSLLAGIMGLLPDQPKAGDIQVDGRSVRGRSTESLVRLGLGFVPEKREVFPALTVRDHLKLGAYSRRDQAEIQADLRQIFQDFPLLESRQKQLAGTLSGGEQQQLLIAKALMARPKILLLDEPSLGLAPALVQELYQLLNRLRDRGLGILLVEQHIPLALEIADWVGILAAGRLVQSGPPESFAEQDWQRWYLGGTE